MVDNFKEIGNWVHCDLLSMIIVPSHIHWKNQTNQWTQRLEEGHMIEGAYHCLMSLDTFFQMGCFDHINSCS
jgi:hypothetical protein